MDVAQARRLVSLLPPKLVNFFIRYPPRNPSLRTIYSKEDKSLLIAKRLHDFQPVPPDLHNPTTDTSVTSTAKEISTVYLPFLNPFKPSRDPRSGKFHGPRYSLRRQADIIKLAMRYGVAELLPPSDKMNKLLYGKKRPMVGTLKPKGTYEERSRKSYVEKKQKSLEESLRVVAMRKMVHCYFALKLICSGGTLKRIGNEDPAHHGINQSDTSDSEFSSVFRHLVNWQ
jgi:Mitochondrial ribosomal protein mL59